MTTLTQERYTLPGLNALAAEIVDWRIRQGFTMPESIDLVDLMLSKLALVHSEVSEATEAVRKGDLANFREEIADVIIRCLDIAGTLGINLESEIRAKMLRNETRGYRNGGKRA